MLYRRQAERDGRQPGPLQAFLSTDGSGRYPILVEDGGTVIGWIHDGSFRPLALGHYVELWGYG